MSALRVVDDLLLEWAVYQAKNARARMEYARPLAECPYCAGTYTERMMPRHLGLCASFCQKCGSHLDEQSIAVGACPDCVAGVVSRGGDEIAYVSLGSAA